ncbi:MAG: preprotein translocase subunit SecG [Oscillospiraceae bacterium]|nr:preprotein translocase subunit SecG [Oscillospiraceae bacterium]
MSGLQIAAAVIMIILSLAIIVIVLLQKDRQSNLSGTITGGDSSFFDKTKGKRKEAAMENITKILAGLFFLLAIAAGLMLIYG